jgi:hypothetical protein
VAKFYLESMVEKNCKGHNDINERNGMASKFYHLAKGLLRNKDIGRKCKLQYKTYFKMILLYGAQTLTCTNA